MRELPDTKLVKASDFSDTRSPWMVVLPSHDDREVGMVVRDYDVLLPTTNEPWQAFTRSNDGPRAYQHLSWHRTRAEAVEAVAMTWQAMQDEIEAYAVLDAIQAGIDGAEELAAEQMAIDPHAHLIDSRSVNGGLPLDDASEILKGLKEYGELIVRRQLNGEEELRIPALESVTRKSRLIELELKRRNRHRAVADLLKSSRIEREADQNSSFLFKPVDSWLVTELSKAMTNPRRAVSLDMATLLLDQVRTLEALALETEKLRPASMVVQIQDDVLEPLVERIQALEKRVDDIEDDLAEDEGLPAFIDELAGVPFDVPEVVSCDCPRSDDDVHEQGCVNHPAEMTAEPSEDPDWRSDPHGLPPATTEGVECSACRDAGKRHLGLTASVVVHHATQEDVDECMRRQQTLPWSVETKADGQDVYRWYW